MRGALLLSAEKNLFCPRNWERLPFVPSTSIEELLARFEQCGYRAAIIGQKGRGKSALKNALVSALKCRPKISVSDRLLREDSSFSEKCEVALAPLSLWWATPRLGRAFLVLDGYEQLSRPLRALLLLLSRMCGGLLVISHQETVLPTLHRCETSFSLFVTLLSRVDTGHVIPTAVAQAAYDRSFGDIRQAFRYLYDWFALYGLTRETPPPSTSICVDDTVSARPRTAMS